MAEEQKAKITPKGFRQTLGIDTTKYADANRRQDAPMLLKRYGEYEAKNMLTKLMVSKTTPSAYTDMNGAGSGVISYLKSKNVEIGRKTAKLKKLKMLAPEIAQAQTLVASSIMSPNDMQEGEFSFNFPGVNALDNDTNLKAELTELYSLYFNTQLELGTKCYTWVADALYETGAKAILLLPPDVQTGIANRTAQTIIDERKTAGMESFEAYTDRIAKDDDFIYSNRPTTWASIFANDVTDDIKAIVPAMESLQLRIPEQFQRVKPGGIVNYSSSDSEYTAGLEDMIVNMKTKLAKGDLIKISENPEIVRFKLSKEMFAKKNVDDKLDSKYGPKKYVSEMMVSLDTGTGELSEGSRPTMIELPTESVIPIIVHGAPSEHLGYFIILDEFGQPLVYSDAEHPDPNTMFDGDGANDTTSESFSATYGTSNNVVRLFGGTNAAQTTKNTVFEFFLDKFVKEHLKGLLPNEEIELSKFNSIATTMFFRLMANKRTTIVYAPPRLLHYLAFDYRDDGTGMPKPENIEFILGLRTTLMVSNILAAANDAINHKKIEFDAGEDIKNLEQISDLIRNIFISKNKISGSIDPSEIMSEISSNAITLVPKNVPGLGTNFNVDVQHTGSQSIRADDNLLENLSNLLVSNLDVPPSALNQLSEPEYARSLVTYNLFFAKKVGIYQRITCKFISQLIRDFTRYDSVFQHAITTKLQVVAKANVKERMPRSVAALKKMNTNQYSSINNMLKACLEGVSVELPKTNIVVDKTQFEEIRNYIDSVDQLAQKMFDDELVPSNDEVARVGLQVSRARWKQEQLKQYITRIGTFKMVDIPDFDDLTPSEDITDAIQAMQNLGMAINRQSEMASNVEQDSSGSFGGGDSYDSDDGGSDTDDDIGGDFSDDDLGDTDTGSDEESGMSEGEPELEESSEEPEGESEEESTPEE